MVLGQFTEIIEAYKAISKDLDDSESLDNFFNVMQHFNNDIEMDYDLKTDIRNHFLYRWQKDKNQFVEVVADHNILEQLP